MASQRNQAERSGSAQTKTTRGRVDGQRKGQSTVYKGVSDQERLKFKKAKQDYESMQRKSDPLSMCAKLYAIAAVDPWGCPEPPCVPDNVNLPSYKFAARSRGTMATGGTCAFIQYSPYNMIQSTNAAVWYTNSTFNTTVTANSGTTITTAISDSTFGAAFFNKSNANNTWRLVGAGVRVRYIGPEQYRSGQMIMYSSPGNAGIGNGIGGPELLNNRNTTTAVCDREWHSVVWKPSDPTDLDYFDIHGVTSGQPIGRVNDASGTAMVFLTGLNTNCSFEYEVVSWFEVVGPLISGLTPSHSDATGLAAVSSARGVVNSGGSVTDSVTSFMSATYDALTHMSGLIMPSAPRLLGFAKQLAAQALSTSGSSLGETLSLGSYY